MKSFWDGWKQKARLLKRETYVLWLACRDPRTPWHARALAVLVTGYAFSPIDLIPDFIPILGYVDDLVLIPLGVALTVKAIPKDVLDDCRRQAQELIEQGKPVSRVAGVVIGIIWLVVLAWAAWRVWNALR
jgi:uncharacterized membrane protein YkvA (DUF1232 family)